MVESAPLFIEYCCVGYMHIDAVKAIIALAVIYPFVASTFTLLTEIALEIYKKRKSK